jgi:hypothetical protein
VIVNINIVSSNPDQASVIRPQHVDKGKLNKGNAEHSMIRPQHVDKGKLNKGNAEHSVIRRQRTSSVPFIITLV